ncbi:hypothetical protein [Neotamlana laminarinivorans]|uniref:Uncharacterized protein n=1 Tax=Neotamlana laminarinivorans TaxID=2883124 RepID=A0A9X1I1U1_9FLAO|nr:hypothetical protein [Tamlana laminarinivorans]MCB4800213.1 hypothetical protein [Tamlana laminarinivorans]
MTIEKLTELAEKENKLTKAELELKLTELKSLNCRILECIVYVRTNQRCSLFEAKEIVVNSSAWIKQKDEFIRHQQEQMAEFMEAAKDDIESIKQTYSTEKTETIIKMKK